MTKCINSEARRSHLDHPGEGGLAGAWGAPEDDGDLGGPHEPPRQCDQVLDGAHVPTRLRGGRGRLRGRLRGGARAWGSAWGRPARAGLGWSASTL